MPTNLYLTSLYTTIGGGLKVTGNIDAFGGLTLTIPSYAAVQVVCSGQHVYVVGGEYA